MICSFAYAILFISCIFRASVSHNPSEKTRTEPLVPIITITFPRSQSCRIRGSNTHTHTRFHSQSFTRSQSLRVVPIQRTFGRCWCSWVLRILHIQNNIISRIIETSTHTSTFDFTANREWHSLCLYNSNIWISTFPALQIFVWFI